jgi:hypothetical protein
MVIVNNLHAKAFINILHQNTFCEVSYDCSASLIAYFRRLLWSEPES